MHSRRSVLAGCSGLLSTTVLGGCSVLQSGGGGPDRSSYTEWMYESEEPVVTFGYSDVSTLTSIDGLPERLYESSAPGYSIENVDYSANFQNVGVLVGSFDNEALRDGWEDEVNGEVPWDVTLEANGEYAGYRRYAASGLRFEIAIAEGSAVVSLNGDLERFLDAGTGSAPSLVEDNDDADALTDRMGVAHRLDGTVASIGDEPVYGDAQVGVGTTREYGPETTEMVDYTIFETENEVDEEAVRNRVETSQTRTESVRTDGRFVEVEYTRPTSDLIESDDP